MQRVKARIRDASIVESRTGRKCAVTPTAPTSLDSPNAQPPACYPAFQQTVELQGARPELQTGNTSTACHTHMGSVAYQCLDAPIPAMAADTGSGHFLCRTPETERNASAISPSGSSSYRPVRIAVKQG